MSPRPLVHDKTEELYESIGSGFTKHDESTDWDLLKYLDAIGNILGEVSDLVESTDDTPGWASALDPDVAEVENLPWLAQFTGTVLNRNLPVAEQRQQIKDASKWQRGTVAALVHDVKKTLTGTKKVMVGERAGTNRAYRLAVQTLPAETPDEDATERAILGQKPGGIVLDYQAIAVGTTFGMVAAHYPTFQALRDDHATFQSLRDWQPVGA